MRWLTHLTYGFAISGRAIACDHGRYILKSFVKLHLILDGNITGSAHQDRFGPSGEVWETCFVGEKIRSYGAATLCLKPYKLFDNFGRLRDNEGILTSSV